MIEIKDAIKKVVESEILLEIQTVDLTNSLGTVLAHDVVSLINMPPFDQSAMDGYAISGNFNGYTVIGEIKAGDSVERTILQPGEAIRIFTGGVVPTGATAIAKQEIVKREENYITLFEEVKTGTSIRNKGEEIEINQIALSKGTLMTPGAIGFLTGLGIQTIQVYAKPKIGIVVTGNELLQPGESLSSGKVYESNSASLTSALVYSGFDSDSTTVKDDYNATKKVLIEQIESKDVVIITGGISVGDYDFVGKALTEIGVNQVFYKVNQKPGKPLYYGTYRNTKIFGLPGNPAAALTCFYVYVLPAIKKMMGNDNPELEIRKVQIKHNYLKKGDRPQLLKSKIDQFGAEVLISQSSSMLSSFVQSNCLMHIESGEKELKIGEFVQVYLLPNR